MLGMQPEFLYPRRSRFAPMISKNNKIAWQFYETRLTPLKQTLEKEYILI
jgi:hypothetical protein